MLLKSQVSKSLVLNGKNNELYLTRTHLVCYLITNLKKGSERKMTNTLIYAIDFFVLITVLVGVGSAIRKDILWFNQRQKEKQEQSIIKER